MSKIQVGDRVRMDTDPVKYGTVTRVFKNRAEVEKDPVPGYISLPALMPLWTLTKVAGQGKARGEDVG